MLQTLETRHLQLDDVPIAAWSAFHGGLAPAIAPELAATWERSRNLGALPAGVPSSDLLVRGSELSERFERVESALVHLPSVLANLDAPRVLRDFSLLVADGDGVVVRAFGGGAFAGEASRVRLIEGACWSEATRGTNAIGTSASEGTAVSVFGHAHYGADFHGLVCYAVPVHGPDGSLVTVLDATSYLQLAAPDALGTVIAAGRAWERLLRAAAYRARGFISDALDRRRGAALLIEPPGRIVRGNEAARQWLVHQTVDVTDVLGLDWLQLSHHATSPRSPSLTIELGPTGAPHRMQLEPVVGSDGNVIAIVAELTPLLRKSDTRPRRVDAFDRLYASDTPTRAAIDWARRIAKSELAVMILGETGSGKELVAQAIHAESKRSAGPFVAVNCGAIAPQLLESELFGYAPGAFTGAERQGRHGLIHAATGGTLFLDEVADMPAAMQVALLRVLENNVYRRVGESEAQTADVRIVCATCRDLSSLVDKGEFRRDLYFRLKGATVMLPPLRSRSDLALLAQHLLDELAQRDGRLAPSLSPELAGWICEQSWPGNVRELKSVLEVALVLAGDAMVLELEFLPPDLNAHANGCTSATPLDDVEGHAVRRALSEVAGNVSAAAMKLGVARSTLYRMMRRHGLLVSPHRARSFDKPS